MVFYNSNHFALLNYRVPSIVEVYRQVPAVQLAAPRPNLAAPPVVNYHVTDLHGGSP